jgi:CRISPR system Cascade subunit CasC
MAERLGIRTKRAPKAVAELLEKQGRPKSQAKALALAFFDALYGIKEEKTVYLLYVGPEELQRAAALLLQTEISIGEAAENLAQLRSQYEKLAKKEKENAKKQMDEAAKPFLALAEQYKKSYPKHVRAVDVALFGRMLADNPAESIDAACQVSHAISVNRINLEFDYFTAVDDLQQEDNAGAGMIGTIGFASSCFYRFACVDLELLARNLGGDRQAAYEGVLAFAEAFIQARPSGKQNTFAAHSLPSLVMVVARESGQPVSLVNAFEHPIKPSEGRSLSSQAIESLGIHYGKLKKMYGLQGQAACVIMEEDGLQPLAAAGVAVLESVPAVLEQLKSSLTSNFVSA